MIWEMLDPKTIFHSMEAKSVEDVFEKLGSAMIQEGYAKTSYIEALKEREDEFPTGLDINGVGVAIPHTGIEHVYKTGIGIATLKEPIEFIQMDSDEEVMCKIIFMLCIKNPKTHIYQLQRIIEIIQDQDVLKEIQEASTTEKIITIIKNKEKNLQ